MSRRVCIFFIIFFLARALTHALVVSCSFLVSLYCSFSFGGVQIHYGRPAGYDMVRGAEIGNKNVELTHIEEAFTSEHWMVRIYRVKNEKTHPNFQEKLARKGK